MLERLRSAWSSAMPARRSVNASAEHRPFASAVAANVLVKVVAAIFQFVLMFSLARVLGGEKFGVYTYAISLAGMAALFSQAGFMQTNIRFLTEYRVEEQWGLHRGFEIFSRRIVFGSGFFLSIILGILSQTVLRNSAFSQATLFAAPLVLLLSVFQFRVSQLMAFKKFVVGHTLQGVLLPIGMLAGLCTIVFGFGQESSANLILGIQLVVVFALSIVATSIVKSKTPEQVLQAAPQYLKTQWLSVALTLLLVNGFTEINARLDAIMLGAMIGELEVGAYRIATQVSTLVVFSLFALSPFISQQVSESHAKREFAQMSTFLFKSSSVLACIALLSTIAIFCFGKPILRLIGSEFLVAYHPLLVLCAGKCVYAICGPAGAALTVIGRHYQLAVIFGFSALLNVIGNFVLIPQFGMMGAAISSAATTVVANASMLALMVLILRSGADQ